MVALATAPIGEKIQVVKIDANKALLTRLRQLGIREGDALSVIQNNHGYLIIGKEHLRLALGRGLGHKIWVKKFEGNGHA